MSLATIRRALLRAEDATAAIDCTITYVRREVGPAILLPEDAGEEAEREWLASSEISDALTIPLRTRSGEVLGRILVARATSAANIEERLGELAEDLAEALDRLRLVDGLRGELALHQELVKNAGEALTRDAREVVRALSELERRDATTKAELHQALRFQRAMLPPLPRSDDFTCEALYLPAELISGDFYDVALVAPGRVRIFVADATGHGIAAGLATMFLKSEYEAQKRTKSDPCEVLRSMNDHLVSSYGNLELRFTAACIEVDVATGAVTYSTAAHPAPLFARASGTAAHPSGGPFVGLVEGLEFPTYQSTIEPGDIILCATDGLTDATSEDGAMFGEARVARVLAEARRERGSVTAPLVRALADFVGRGRRLADDVSVVVFSLASR